MADRVCHAPHDPAAFARDLDNRLTKLNVYYDDLITGAILQPLHLTSLPRGAFQRYMKSQGKLGGQNKVPGWPTTVRLPMDYWKPDKSFEPMESHKLFNRCRRPQKGHRN